MKASEMIGLPLVHATDGEISGTVTDLLFDMSLTHCEFLLITVSKGDQTAPVLFSPTVLVLEEGAVKTGMNPDEIGTCIAASLHRNEVAVDLSGLPSTIVGPFGNTISPSMIAAMFNARTAIGNSKPLAPQDGLWVSALFDRPVHAHVGEVGRFEDLNMDDHFTQTQTVEVKTIGGQTMSVSPSRITASYTPDDQLQLAIRQAPADTPS